jgi:dephospho-CoA kinase
LGGVVMDFIQTWPFFSLYKLLVISVSICCWTLFFVQPCDGVDALQKGRIIFITGSCSAGKSSMSRIVAQKLQAKYFAFDEYVMPLILKKFITKHYGKVLAYFVSGMVMRNFFSSVNLLSEKSKHKFQLKFLADLRAGMAVEPTSKMYKEAKKVAALGQDVVVESPIFLFDGVTCLESLKEFDGASVTYVLAYCPWEHLIARIKKRNALSDKKNRRELDWVLGNYVQCIEPSVEYKGPGFLEQLGGSTVHAVVEQYSRSEYKKQRMCLLGETQEAVLSTFPTDAKYYVYPRFDYNVIVNTKAYAPCQGAAMVLGYLNKKRDIY